LREGAPSHEPLGSRELGAFACGWRVKLLEVGENSKIVVVILTEMRARKR
jgi:hypothetical protein